MLARLSIPILFCVVLGSSCRRPHSSQAATDVPAGTVLAKVDGVAITTADIDRHLAKLPPAARERYRSAEQKKLLLDSLVRFEVIAKEAQKQGFDKDPEVIQALKQQMINMFIQRQFSAKFSLDEVPEAEVKKYYDTHPSEFNRPDQVRALEILVTNKATAAKVAAAARALTPNDYDGFRALVTKYSENPVAKARGGDLGAIDRSETVVPKPVVEAAFALREVNDVSPPVATDEGFHVLKLAQKISGHHRSMLEAKRDIQARLSSNQKAKKQDDWFDTVRAAHNVEVFSDGLREVALQ